MAEVLLFHHAEGVTLGVVAFADTLRRAGHRVHTPDLFDGRTFDTLKQGMQFVEERGFGALIERGARAAEELPAELADVPLDGRATILAEGSNFTRFARNSNTCGDIVHETDEQYRPAINQIVQDAARPSCLILPIVER